MKEKHIKVFDKVSLILIYITLFLSYLFQIPAKFRINMGEMQIQHISSRKK